MADQASLNTDLMDELLKKLDVIYVKLGEIDDRLTRLEGRTIRFAFDKYFTKAIGTLDKLASAFRVLGKATDAGITQFVNNIQKLIRELGQLDISIDDKKFNLVGLQRFAATLERLSKLSIEDATKEVQEIDNLLDMLNNLKIPENLEKKLDLPALNKFALSMQRLTNLDFSEGSKLQKNLIDVMDFFSGKFAKAINELLKIGVPKALAARFIFDSVIQPMVDIIRLVMASGEDIDVRTDMTRRFKAVGVIIQSLGQMVLGFIDFTKKLQSGEIKSKSVRDALLNLIPVFALLGFFITSILKVAKDTDSDAVQGVGASLRGLGDIMQALADLFRKLESLNVREMKVTLARLIIVFVVFRVFFASMVTAFAKIDAAKLESIGPIINGLGGLMLALANLVRDLSRMNTERFGLTLFRLIGLFITLRIFIGSILDATKEASVQRIEAGAALVRAIAQVVSALSAFTRATENTSISGAIGTAVKLLILLVPIRGLIKALVQLGRENDATALNAVANLLRAVADVLGNFPKTLRELDNLTFGKAVANGIKLVFFGVILGRLMKAMVDLSREHSPAQITAVADLIDATSKALTSLAELIDREDKSFLSLNLRTYLFIFALTEILKNVMKGLVKMSKEASPEQMRGAAELIRALGETLDVLGRIADTAPKDGFSKNFKNIFKDLANATKDIVKLTKNSDDKSVRNLIELFKTLGDAFDLIEKIGADKVSLDADKLDAVARQVKQVVNTLNDVKIPFGFRNKIDAIAKAMQALNNIRGGSNAGSFRDSADSLEALFKALNDFKTPPNLKRVTDDIEKLIKVLNDIDGSKADSLRAVAEIITNARGNQNLAEAIERTGKELKNTTDETERATRETKDSKEANEDAEKSWFELGLEILNVANRFDGFLSLLSNPIEATQFFGEFLDGFKELGDEIREKGEELREFGSELVSNFGVGALLDSEFFGLASDFDRLGAQLEVFGGLTDESRAQAEAFAFTIGQKYPLSANDALDATLALIKAGQDLSSVEFILPAAADLAALSDTGDLDAITNTLIGVEGVFNSFRRGSDGVEAVSGTFENISVATDILSAAADVSTASVESLSEGLANVGPAADAFGLSLEETSAILAIFQDAGLQAAEGGTALRSLLNALDRPQTASALRNLGISLFDPESGQRRPINEIINDINASLEDMPEAQRTAVLQQLADTFGRQGLNILLAQGEDGIQNVVDAMRLVDPAGERAAAMLDNFAGDVEQLTGSVETLVTVALLPMLNDVFRPFVKVARFVVDSFLALDRSVIEFIGTMVGLVSVGATAVGGFLVFAGVLLQVGGAIFTVVGFALNFVSVLTAIVAGTIAVVAAFATLTAIVAVIVPTLTLITGAFRTLVEIFRTDAGGATTAVQNFATTLGTIFAEIGSLLSGIGDLMRIIFFGASQGGGAGILESLGTAIANFFNGITETLNSGTIGQMREAIAGAGQIFTTLGDLFDKMREIAGVGDEIERLSGLSGLENVVSGLRGQSEALRAEFRNMVADLFRSSDLFRQVVRNVMGGLSDADIGSTIDFLLDGFTNLGQTLNTEVFGAFRDFVTNIGSLGIGNALTTLLSDLDSGLGFFTSQFIGFISQIFGFEGDIVNDLIDSAGNGFGLFISTLFSTIGEQLRGAALANKDFLREIFINVMSFFLSPLKTARFFANILGIGPLRDFLDFAQGLLEQLFGGVFDTIFSLLEGNDLQTALRDGFGEGIESILGFMSELGRTASIIFETVGNIFKALFGFGDVEESFTDALDFIFGSLTTVLKTINDLILTPLSQGDVLGAFNNIISAVVSGLLSLGTLFTQAFVGLDYPTIFANAASSIVNGFLSVLGSAFTSLGDFFNIDVTGIVESIASTLEANLTAQTKGEGVEGPFATAANTIVGLFAAAVNTALVGIGALFGIDTTAVTDWVNNELTETLTAIEDAFVSGEDGSSVFDSIATIINNIVTAFTNLFGIETEGAPDFGAILTPLATALGLIANLTLSVIEGILTQVDTFFKNIADLSSNDLFAISLAMGTVFTVLAIAGGSVNLTALSTTLTTLIPKLSSLWSTLRPFAGLLAAMLIFNAIIANLGELNDVVEELMEGDLLGSFQEALDALLNILVDLGLSVFDLLGIDIGKSRDEIIEIGRNIGEQLEIIFTLSGHHIANFFRDMLAELDLAGRSAAAQLDAALPGGSAGEAFFEVEVLFKSPEGLDIATLFDTTQDEGLIRAFASANMETFIDASVAKVNELIDAGQSPLQALADPDVVHAAAVATAAGFGSDFLKEIEAQFGAEGISTLAIQLAPTLDANTFEKFRSDLQFLIDTGVITTEEAIQILADVEANTTNEEVAAAADEAQTKLQAELDDETVTVTADVEVETGDVDTDDVATETETQTNAQPLTVTMTADVDVQPATVNTDEVAPAVEEAVEEDTLVIQPETAADVEELGEDVELLRTRIGLMRQDLTDITQPILDFITNITNMQTALTTMQPTLDTTSTTLTTVATTLGTINTNLTTVNSTLVLMMVQILLWQVVMFAAFNFALQGAERFFNYSIVSVQTLITGLTIAAAAMDKLGVALLKAETNAKALNAQLEAAAANQAAATNGGSGGGGGEEPPDDGNRAIGGMVLKGGRYNILEKGASEVLYEKGKAYLLASGTGRIEPLDKALTKLNLSPSSRSGVFGGLPTTDKMTSSAPVINQTTTIQEGATSITITGVSGDPEAIADAVERRMDERKRESQRNVKNRLRTNNR